MILWRYISSRTDAIGRIHKRQDEKAPMAGFGLVDKLKWRNTIIKYVWPSEQSTYRKTNRSQSLRRRRGMRSFKYLFFVMYVKDF